MSDRTPKRILVISHRLPYPPNKGEKIRTFYQLKFLAEKGHSLHLLSLSESEEDQQQSKLLDKELGSTSQLFLINRGLFRLFAYGMALLSGRSFSEAHFSSKALSKHLNELARDAQRPFDALLLTGSALTHYLSQFDASVDPKLRPKPIVRLMDFMDVDSDKWLQYAERARGLKRWVFRREAKKVAVLERRALASCDHCFLISDNEVQRFIELHPQAQAEPKVLANGVDFIDFPPLPFRHLSDIEAKAKSDPGKADRSDHSKDEKSPVLMFMGVMDYAPNEDAVVFFVESCFINIREQIPGARFVIVGMNPSEVVLNLARFDGVEVTGTVDSVAPYLQQAHLFVAPFRIARGVQNKVLQAMSSRIAVVTSSMGNEGINAPGIVFTGQNDSLEPPYKSLEPPYKSLEPPYKNLEPPYRNLEPPYKSLDRSSKPALALADSAEASVEACVALLKKDSLRLALAAQGRQFVTQHFSWDACLQDLNKTLTD